MTNEELIKEAKRRYPVGTKFKCLVTQGTYTMPDNITFRFAGTGMYSYQESSVFHQHYDLRNGGTWAKIVSKPEVKEEPASVKKELTALPEKWVVRNPQNEESHLLYGYANVHGAMPPYTFGTYFHFPSFDYCTTRTTIVEGYTEITFDQFKKWVLGVPTSGTKSQELKVKDLVEGEIYFQEISKFSQYIFRMGFFTAVSVNGKSFYKDNWKDNEFRGTLRKATEEEKQWLEACIKAGRFVSLEDSKKQVSEVPKYVECIQKDARIEIGTIYEVIKSSTAHGKPTYFINGTEYYQSYFKPSTKNAYEAQFKKEVNLIGRYLKYIGSSKSRPAYGDYFRIDSMEEQGLFRLSDNEPDCCWNPEEFINGICKSFELMPEGWKPEVKKTGTVDVKEPISKNNTVEDWFNTLPSHLRDKAVQYCADNPYSHTLYDRCDSLEEALQNGFYWDETHEGEYFWHKLELLVATKEDISTYGLSIFVDPYPSMKMEPIKLKRLETTTI